MSKRNNKPAEVLDWRAIWEELERADDRAAVLVGEEILNYSLARLLSSYLVNDQSEVPSLFDYPGSLSSLFTKATLAYCLGLITKRQLADLKAMNRLRNHLAHRLQGSSFNDPVLTDKLLWLEGYRHVMTADQADSPRKQFNVAVSVLAYALTNASMTIEHRSEAKAPDMSEVLRSMLLY
jgi:DNA-binding MltR family transcriptional regulator